jgi:sugar lactone lactonase YvrE
MVFALVPAVGAPRPVLTIESNLEVPVVLLSLLAACGAIESDEPCAAPGVVCTYAGMPGVAWAGQDGMLPKLTGLYYPAGITIAADGVPYLLDMNNHRLRAPDQFGMLQTVAGTGFSGVGGGGDALGVDIGAPADAVLAPDGTMFVVLRASSRVERFDPVEGSMEVVAGTGWRGYAGDGGDALDAMLQVPQGIALGPDGEVYISDTANNVIRVVRPDGVIQTFAGDAPKDGTFPSSGYSGDGGPSLGALLDTPAGLAVIGRTLYIADSGNHAIRAVDIDAGTIDLVAGTPELSGFVEGHATESAFNWPSDITPDLDGRLVIADEVNHCVRVLDHDGVVRTLAGQCTTSGFSGDGGPAIDALFNNPHAITVAPDGTLWVADTLNQVVRTVAPTE